jgi:hypothetical protein
MAEGHREAAHSVLDGGEHQRHPGRVGDRKVDRFRSSGKRTCGLTDNRVGLAFYEKMGFRTYETLRRVPLRDGTPVDRILKRYDVV